MKVVTIGQSPYLLTSHARIHAEIMKHLYTSRIQIASVVWGHDRNYFAPVEREDGSKRYYFDFKYQNSDHRIPIFPFNKSTETPVHIHEILKILDADVVVCVGDCEDFCYMKAVKQFHPTDLKWFFVMMKHGLPFNDENVEITRDADGVLCTSEICFEAVKNFYPKDELSWSYVGCDHELFEIGERNDPRFRVMVSGKNAKSDCIPSVMQAAAMAREHIPDLQLYIHANLDDSGDFDLQALKSRFDPESQFILFPSKFVSLIDGLSSCEYSSALNRSDVFVSIPMSSSCSLSVFEALATGCHPIMTDCGVNRELATLLHEATDLEREDFLAQGIEIVGGGGYTAIIADPKALGQILVATHKILQKRKGHNELLSEFTQSISWSGSLW